MLKRAMTDKRFLTELNRRQPMNRVGIAKEIAQAALFLADDKASSFITGQALVIDGGQTAQGRGRVIAHRVAYLINVCGVNPGIATIYSPTFCKIRTHPQPSSLPYLHQYLTTDQ